MTRGADYVSPSTLFDSWREDPLLNQSGTLGDAMGEIDSQHPNCSSANGGTTTKLGTDPAKVMLPTVPPWVEKPNEASALGVDARRLVPLELLHRKQARARLPP